MKRLLVYSCVFGGYDRIYPPVIEEEGVDYVLVTDGIARAPRGWREHVVDPSPFPTPKAANLHYRALIHRELPGYDLAFYMDGNVRRTKPVRPLLEAFGEEGVALGVYPHPLRDTVAAEVEACIEAGKVADPALLRRQIESYLAAGFEDDLGLIETTVMLRDHRNSDLDRLMAAWADEFGRWPTRDQIALPMAFWTVGAMPAFREQSFRAEGMGFLVSPHASRPNVNPIYAHLHAMSATSLPHRIVRNAWEAKWAVQRALRSQSSAL